MCPNATIYLLYHIGAKISLGRGAVRQRDDRDEFFRWASPARQESHSCLLWLSPVASSYSLLLSKVLPPPLYYWGKCLIRVFCGWVMSPPTVLHHHSETPLYYWVKLSLLFLLRLGHVSCSASPPFGNKKFLLSSKDLRYIIIVNSVVKISHVEQRHVSGARRCKTNYYLESSYSHTCVLILGNWRTLVDVVSIVSMCLSPMTLCLPYVYIYL